MISFVGPSYTLATRKASAQRSVNMHLVGMETPSKVQFIMTSVPGLLLFAALGQEVRGCITAGARCFVVAGSGLYELTSAGVATLRGSLSTPSGPVDMALGLLQLVMVDGPNGYVLTLATNTFARITSPNFYGADRVGYLDGFFLFNRPATQQWYISAIDDATALDALDFASAEGAPDNLVSLLVAHREVWLFGEATTEIWFNAGSADFTFQRNNGAAIEVGCIACHSAQKVDNGVIWIGRDQNGSGIVYRAQGYLPQRVSTQAVEQALQASTDLSKAVSYIYQQDGLTFWCVNAPGLASTWCYEISTGTWHERCEVGPTGAFIAGRATRHVFAFGKHLVGDAAGNVYEMSKTTYTNNGDALKRSRTSPNESVPSRERIYYREFILDCTTGEAGQGIAPVAELSWSNDSGATFCNPVMRSIGLVGERFARVKWSRLGHSRDRVWKLEFSGDAPFDIIQGEAS